MEKTFGRLLAGLFLIGCFLLFSLMMVIVADVFLRNVHVPGAPRGLEWGNEISEVTLYLVTMFVAPWLLRQGQHIRVDIVLQVLPREMAWRLEWLGDLIGLACCLAMTWYSAQGAWSSFQSGAMNIKTLVTPEWWTLAPLPFVFGLLSIEMVFRMKRLLVGERGPRQEAVSAS